MRSVEDQAAAISLEGGHGSIQDGRGDQREAPQPNVAPSAGAIHRAGEEERRPREWRRSRAILGYIEGKRVVDLAELLDVTRGSVNRWIGWYEKLGIPGIRTRLPPGVPPKLSAEQHVELTELIDAGPMAAGYGSGVWTGPMIAAS